MTVSIKNCLRASGKLAIVALVKKKKSNKDRLFYNLIWNVILEELGKSHGKCLVKTLAPCLVNAPILMPYDVDLEAWTCSCRRWQVAEIHCPHALTVLRDKKLPRRTIAMNDSLRKL